jgi:CheY-like chemotaxis protein
MTETVAPRKTVLVVEDDPEIRNLVTDALESDGYEVLTATNGEDALQIVTSTRTDAVLVDIMLPKVDGRQFIRMCKADPATRDIPMLVMSAGYDARRDAELADLVFVAKPFDIEMLLMLVDDAVTQGDSPTP